MELKFTEEFSPKYNGTMFAVTPATFEYVINVAMDPDTKAGKAYRKYFEKDWEKKMKKLRKEEEEKYADVIEDTEKRLHEIIASKVKSMYEKGIHPAKINEWALDFAEEHSETANKMIEKAMKTYESVFIKEATKSYHLAAAKVDKQYKTKLTTLQIQAVLKIATNITVAVGSFGIGATLAIGGIAGGIATEGVGFAAFTVIAPAVLGLFVVGIKNTKAIVDTIRKDRSTALRFLGQLEKATIKLRNSVQYVKKKADKSKLGPKEKLTLLLTNVKGDLKVVMDNISACEAFRYDYIKKLAFLHTDLNNYKDSVEKLTSAGKDPNKEKSEKTLKELLEKIDSTQHYIKRNVVIQENLEKALMEGKKIASDAKNVDIEGLGKFIGKIQTIKNNEDVSLLIDHSKVLISHLTATIKLVGKLV